MRLPFFRSKPAVATPTRAERARTAAAADEPTLVEAARIRARRRLAGALVLLVTGVVGFPIVFETQPRPLPVDTPILVPSPAETVRRETPAAAARPPVRPVTQAAIEAPTEAALEAVASASSPRPISAVQPVVITERAAAATAPAAPAIVAPPAVAAAASALGSGAVASAGAGAGAGAGRFVVQVGAYTDPATLREARARVEKLGFKTYTQVVGSTAGPRTRVRLGPYSTRDEADAAAARLRRAGLPANILAL